MTLRLHWGMFSVQCSSTVLLFFLSRINSAQEGSCANVHLEILNAVSMEHHVFDTTLTTENLTQFVVSHFNRQSKFQFQRTNKVACFEPMSYWAQGYSPGEESK